MIKAAFTPTGQWKRLKVLLDPERFKRSLQVNMEKATAVNGMLVVAEIRKRIRARRYAANSPLTILIKGSSKPLVDNADLFNAITSEPVNPTTVFVGVLRTARDPKGSSLANIAQLLHEGGTISVTDKMRHMFSMLADYAAGKVARSDLEGRTAELADALGDRVKQIKPLKASTVALRIPPRPFMLTVFTDPAILKKIKKNWEKALQASIQAEGEPGSQEKGPGMFGGGSHGGGGRGRARKPKKPPANRSEAAKRGWKTRRSRLASAPSK